MTHKKSSEIRIGTGAKVPCQQCANRSTTCHSNCLKYLDFVKQNDILKEKKHKANMHDDYAHNKYWAFNGRKRGE